VALVNGGSIAGTVLGGRSAKPERGVCVDVLTADRGSFVNWAVTRRGGRYVVPNLPAGRYKVFFGDPSCLDPPGGLAPQWYNGQHTKAAATVVVVRPGQATNGIGATLRSDGMISGMVTGPAPADTSLPGICVAARPLSGARPVVAVSQASGYRLTGLVPAGIWWSSSRAAAHLGTGPSGGKTPEHARRRLPCGSRPARPVLASTHRSAASLRDLSLGSCVALLRYQGPGTGP
jgi:hypothetical protein